MSACKPARMSYLRRDAMEADASARIAGAKVDAVGEPPRVSQESSRAT